MQIQNHKESKKLNRSRYVILGMLTLDNLSGYDIRNAIKKSTSFFWQESLGQIYPTLEKLRNEGCVKRTDDPKTNRNRLIYSITNKGRNEFQDWLVKPFIPAVERNELLLKMFFAGQTSPTVALQHLDKAQKDAESYLQLMTEISKSLKLKYPKERDRIFYEATVSAGLLGAKAQIQWVKEIRSKIVDLFNLVDSQ